MKLNWKTPAPVIVAAPAPAHVPTKTCPVAKKEREEAFSKVIVNSAPFNRLMDYWVGRPEAW